MTDAIRCPSCERLLARRLDDGRIEIRDRRTEARLRDGEVRCTKCGVSIAITAESETGFRAVVD